MTRRTSIKRAASPRRSASTSLRAQDPAASGGRTRPKRQAAEIESPQSSRSKRVRGSNTEDSNQPSNNRRAAGRKASSKVTTYKEESGDGEIAPSNGTKNPDQYSPSVHDSTQKRSSGEPKTNKSVDGHRSGIVEGGTKVEPSLTAAKAEESESRGQVKKKRKTKEEKEAEMVPLAQRTSSTLLRIGAHVSAAGGVHNAVQNSVHIGGNAFALFLKSQRKWTNPDIKPEARDQFGSLCQTHSYKQTKHIVPHGSYLVNLCAFEKEKADQAYAGFLDDLQRCESLGIGLYNFHPGNTNGLPRQEALGRLAKQLNRAHKDTKSVVILLENMASGRDGQGNTVGGAFEDLRDVIGQVENKKRIGVCIDTCHAFASGYDLRSPEAFKETFKEFDKVVGAQYLRAFHVNDSKAPLGSKRDLHANIGMGFLGLRAFHTLCNSERFHGIPMILETPIDHKDENGKTVEDKGVWAREIKLLESLAGMDANSEEFLGLERDLATRGSSERARLQDQVDRKRLKESSKTKKGKRKRKTGDSESDDDGDEDDGHSSCREH